MMGNEVEQAYNKYLDKLDRLVVQVKLVSYHAQEAARSAEKSANLALLSAFEVREYLKKVKHET